MSITSPTTPKQLEEILDSAQAAAPLWASTTPAERAAALIAVADELDSAVPELVSIAQRETGLTESRLTGELKRTTVQLRLFADVVREGSYLDARIDAADDSFVLGVRPDIRRMLVPVGVALNFAASNFPFAFSVAGGDSAAALAAGCPLIVKAHPGHPELSVATAKHVLTALDTVNAPKGTFGLLQGQDAGTAALEDDRVDVATFTGSIRVGRLLADKAAARPRPIKFFGELGSVNPTFVTKAALTERIESLASGFLNSVSGSAGQLCTKPGFLWIPAGEQATDFEERVAALAAEAPEQRLLNPGIGRGYIDRRKAVLDAAGVRAIVEGNVRVDEDQQVWATPTIAAISAEDLRRGEATVLDEVFGPFSLIVEYDQESDLPADLANLYDGNLTGTVHIGAGEQGAALSALVRTLEAKVGRVLFNGWPTGVAVTYAQQHGGPYPATTEDSSTSVGTAAISRFLRGVAYQDSPQNALPPALQDSNPWNIPQKKAPAGESQSWGTRYL